MTTVYKKGEEDSEWDDTELIQMYDESIKATYEKIGEGNAKKANESAVLSPLDWKIGDKCMALYHEDELWYPATIQELAHQEAKARVIFEGYENEEWIDMKDLNREIDEIDEEESIDMKSEMIEPHPSQKKPHPSVMPPLGPPPPFALNPTGTIPDDEQAKSAMLMSWYMAGYHTGYYAASKFYHLAIADMNKKTKKK
ncbi:hypothetical protein WR25_04250 [Diploscapter pachys]|uniref:Tudor domain-containing protein n=1 Tax=Diploscapter pachys TaxID=2018661 RepID=A0A2A2K1J3_9BILA|nr:hypothetical protein WR25_04250 [Diploscapter pachys]